MKHPEIKDVFLRAPAGKSRCLSAGKEKENDTESMDHDRPRGGHRCRKHHPDSKGAEKEMIIDVKRFYRTDDGGKLKGFADVTLEDAITVKGVRLIEGPNGLFAGMPRRKEKDGEYHDIIVVEDKLFRQAMTNALVREYQKKEPEWTDGDCPVEWQ